MIEGPLTGPRIVAPAGTVQMYELAPNVPVAEYNSTPYAQGVVLPVMAAGIPEAPVIVKLRAPPAPQLFVADTVSKQEVKLAGQLMLTALRFVGPVKVPQVALHVYPTARATGVIEYVTSDCPH